jgi:ribosomal protein S12 methylthiotransferase accessory factor
VTAAPSAGLQVTAALAKGHAGGTHRLVPPATTLERIRPHLARFGITRCADITGLDVIGIPVYIAVRPQGRVLQTSNGKGLTATDARVSALMEAIEHWHAEHPIAELRRASWAELVRDGARALSPRGIDGCPARHGADRQVLDWVLGDELMSGEPAWIPAFAAYYHRGQPYEFSYNGLASGNHRIEAALHALYEITERDTLAALSGAHRVHLERCRVLDLARPPGDGVGALVEQIRRAGLELVVLFAPSATPVHTALAVLLDRSAFSGASAVNFGAGAHLSPEVAAIRAITEAAQSRLTFIHGSREDLNPAAYEHGATHDALLAYFAARTPDTAWSELADGSTCDLASDLARVLDGLRATGRTAAYLADLSHGAAGISAVKAVVPGARVPSWI